MRGIRESRKSTREGQHLKDCTVGRRRVFASTGDFTEYLDTVRFDLKKLYRNRGLILIKLFQTVRNVCADLEGRLAARADFSHEGDVDESVRSHRHLGRGEFFMFPNTDLEKISRANFVRRGELRFPLVHTWCRTTKLYDGEEECQKR